MMNGSEMGFECFFLDFNSMSKKAPPYNHPRLAGDASLGLSPIHQTHQKRIQDEPATSSPMTSLLENNFQVSFMASYIHLYNLSVGPSDQKFRGAIKICRSS